MELRASGVVKRFGPITAVDGVSIVVESGDSIDMDEVRSVAKSIASEAAEDLDVPHESAGLMGAPADRVTTYAEENDARYIVVSGRKRSPTGKALFGSVTQSILLNARCPVVSAIRQSTE